MDATVLIPWLFLQSAPTTRAKMWMYTDIAVSDMLEAGHSANNLKPVSLVAAHRFMVLTVVSATGQPVRFGEKVVLP